MKIAGVDEAGRGSLAGAVFAAAVILPKNHTIENIKDSKKLTPATREILFEQIIAQASAYSVAQVDENIIDQINILQASLLAMQQAVLALKIKPSIVLVDGKQKPNLPDYNVKAIIKGDDKVEVISAASILAKVSRDNYMINCDDKYCQYGFKQNKGYPTPYHLKALKKFGPCAIHRLSFKPVKNY